MREFRNRPGELEQFLDGTHPYLGELRSQGVEPDTDAIEKVRPVVEKALNPTPAMVQADEEITDYFTDHLEEGKRLGFLKSSISNEEYITHMMGPKAIEGEDRPKRFTGKPKLPDRNFKFAKGRVFPTLMHAIAFGRIPKSLNAFDALTIYGDNFATTAASRILLNGLKETSMGRWGAASAKQNGTIPSNWVEFAPESRAFRNEIAFLNAQGEPDIGHQAFFVPPEVNDAMRAVFDPNYMTRVPGFMNTRAYASYMKSIELGLSAFHMKALSLTALSNMGEKGIAAAYAEDMQSPEFEAAERRLLRAGGQTTILGRTIEAYKAVTPKSLPDRMDKLRSAPGLRQLDQVASAIGHATFDVMQRKFKVTDFALKTAAWNEAHSHATPGERFNAERKIAKEINAAYGGLNWEALGVHRITLELSKLALLAPDWTYSNLFNAKYATEKGPGGKAARLFWLRGIIYGLALTQAASLMFTGKPSKQLTKVYMGKDDRGREIYVNVFFVGAHADGLKLIDNVQQYGAWQGLGRSVLSKISPPLKFAAHVVTNQDDRGNRIAGRSMGGPAATLAGTRQAAKDLIPIPFGLSTIVEMIKDPNRSHLVGEYLASIAGGTPTVGMTRAERFMSNYYEDQRPALAAQDTARQEAKREILKRFRAGDYAGASNFAGAAIRGGIVTPEDINHELSRAQMPVFIADFRHMPIDKQIEALKLMDESERKLALPVFAEIAPKELAHQSPVEQRATIDQLRGIGVLQ